MIIYYIYIYINIEHIPNGFCTPFADDSPTLLEVCGGILGVDVKFQG
jgi:hypothetical protein